MKPLLRPRSSGAELPDSTKVQAAPLGFWSATALVVASMIGTGVFTTSGFLLADLKTPANVVLVWAAGGVLASLGALSYGALARHLPESGGEYLFLSRTLSPAVGYVAGWISFLVGFSAPLAFAAYAFGEYSRFWWPAWPSKLSGSILLLLLSLIHAAHVRRGAWVQNATVLIKLALLIGFSALGCSRLGSGPAVTVTAAPVSVSTWAVSLMWVSFAYSGWNAAVYVGAEVREAEKTLPRAMLSGTLLVVILYLVVNSVFVYSGPVERLAGKPDIGRIAAETLGGLGWAQAMSSLVALVLISSVSAQIMAGPRVYSKMAADGYLPRCLAMGQHPPRLAIALQALVALAMLWSASFEWFLTYIGFTLGLSTAATVLGLIRLRLREGATVRVPGWPWVPTLFLVGVLITTALSVVAKPIATLTGLGTVAVSWLLWRMRIQGASRSDFRERGGAWVISQTVMMVGVIAVAVVCRSERVPLLCRFLGGLCLLAGAMFGLAGIAVLKGNRTIFPKPRVHSRLVQEGIYSYVRHPLYTSVMLLAGGWSLVWGSWLALGLSLTLVPFFYAKAKVEERWLRERFPDYAEYEGKVRRFLPWLW